MPDEHKDKVILRKHYEIAQGIIQNINVPNEYTDPVIESTKFPKALAIMVGSYVDNEAYARMQAVRIPRTDNPGYWERYLKDLNNAATNSAISSSALPSSSLAGAAPNSSSSAGGGGEGPEKGPGIDGPNIS